MKHLKQNGKRALALFLAMIMCLGMLQITAFAAEEESHEHNPISCTTCGGSGTVDEISECPTCGGELEMISCEKCGGEGTIPGKYWTFEVPCPNNGAACSGCEDCNSGYAWIYEDVTCNTCNGEGQFPAATVETIPCDQCGGEGQRVKYSFDWNTPCPVNGEACDGCDECIMGYKKIAIVSVCSACDGWGTIVVADGDACETCGGRGEVKSFYNCDDCNGTGSINCTGAFVAGDVVKNDDGSGSQTYACEACGASYEVSLTHAEVVEALGDEGHVYGEWEVIQAPTCTEPGVETTSCTVEGCGATGFTREIEATGHQKPENGEGIEYVAPTCSAAGSETYTCTVCGEEIAEEIPALEHAWKGNVCTNCGDVNIGVMGLNYGRWYGYIQSTADNSAGKKALNSLVGQPMTAETFGEDTTYTDPETKQHFWGEYVTNYATNKEWQCVGFVPGEVTYLGSESFEASVMRREDNSDPSTSLETVKQEILEQGGVLYGDTLTQEQAEAVAQTLKGYRSPCLQAVWFISDTSLQEASGKAYTGITPVEPIESDKSSEGVEFGDLDIVKNGWNYDVSTTVTITDEAPEDAEVVINLAQALGSKIDVLPGSEVNYHITLKDATDRNYVFISDSAYLGTFKRTLTDNEGYTGFDGLTVPVGAVKDGKAMTPWRVLNTPLLDLGVTKDTLDNDEKIGALLAAKGYENGIQDLGSYYLDWLSANSGRNYDSFMDCDDGDAKLLLSYVQDKNSRVAETCEDVVKAYYYFSYGRLLNVDEQSLYDSMVDKSPINTKVKTALDTLKGDSNEATLDLTLSYAGEIMGNAAQNMIYSFSAGLKLQVKPAGSLTITNRVSGADEANRLVYEYVVEGPGGYRNTVTVQGTGSVTLTDLEPGAYTVRQTNGSIDGYTWTRSGEGFDTARTREVVARGDTVVPFVNTYASETGSLTIRKTLAEGAPEAAETQEFKFTVTGPEGFAPVDVTIEGEGSYTLEGLEPGEYTVSEDRDSAAIDGYVWSVSGTGSVTVEAGEPAEVTVTNTYTLPEPSPEPSPDPSPDPDPDPETTPPVIDVPEETRPAVETPEIPEERFPDVPEEPIPQPEIPEVIVPDEDVPLADVPEVNIPDEDVPLADIPEVVVPDEDVPLADIPEVVIPDEDVPLADIPEVVIPDEDVPLADVPKTGDNSLIWAFTTLFSGIGMLWLMLDKKRREDAE